MLRGTAQVLVQREGSDGGEDDVPDLDMHHQAQATDPRRP